MKLLIALAVLLATPAAAAEIELSPFAAAAGAPVIVDPRVRDYIDSTVNLENHLIWVGDSSFDEAVAALAASPDDVSTTMDGRLAFCVEGGGKRIWVISGGWGGEWIVAGAVVVEPATSSAAGCHRRTEPEASLSPNLPGIGASAADLAATFGGTAADGVVSYQHRTLQGDEGSNWLLITTITYEVRSGSVVAVGLSRRTADTPKGLSRFDYMSPIVVAVQIDLRSFPSSIGPRLEDDLKTFADYGFSDENRVGAAAELYPKDRSWMFAVTVLEATEDRLVLCILDKAMNGGSYRTQDALVFRDGDDGLLVATGQSVQTPACPTLR